jgi:hypothetical protein
LAGAFAAGVAAAEPALFVAPEAAFAPAAGLPPVAVFAAAGLRAPDGGVCSAAAASFETPEPAAFLAPAAPAVRFGAAPLPAAARLRVERGAPAAPPVAPPAAVSGVPVLGASAVCGSSGRSPPDGGCGVLMRLPPLP